MPNQIFKSMGCRNKVFARCLRIGKPLYGILYKGDAKPVVVLKTGGLFDKNVAPRVSLEKEKLTRAFSAEDIYGYLSEL